MKLPHFLWALPLAVAPACMVYDESLLGDDDDSVSTGGTSPTTGGGSGTGGLTTTGGSTSGGSSSGGGSMTGGDGGEGPTGGNGTGGGESEHLVDDLETGSVYSNPPFVGGWDRYIDTNSGTWAAATVDEMVEDRPDDDGNLAFHVHATDFDGTSNGATWGLGVYITLNQLSTIDPIDLSAYAGLRMAARGASAAKTLRIAIEDEESRSNPCPGVDCVAHAMAPPKLLQIGEWTVVEVEFDQIVRTPAFDATQAYAIHLTMDPAEAQTAVEFWIDDIYFYE